MANEVISTPSKREKLYNNLIGTGKVTEQEIGTKDDFISSITDNESAKYLYNNLKSKFDEEEIGDENKFVGYLAPDFSGPLPAGQGNLPLPTNPAEFKGFENPLVKDIAPGTAPLKSTVAPTEIKPVSEPVENNTQQLGDIDSKIESFKKENGDFIQQYEQIRKKIEGDNQAVKYSGREGRVTSFGDFISKAKVSKEERDFYNQNKKKFEELEGSRKAMFIQKDLEQLAANAEKYDPNDSDIKKFVKGLFQTGTLKDFATLGITQISRNLDIEELLHKANTTPKLVTPQEKEAISAYEKLRKIESQDTDWTYKTGQMAQQMVPFVVNMIATGGLGASLKTGIGAALNVGAKTGLAKVGAKLAQGVIFNAPRSLVTTTLGTNFAQNRLQGYDIENGEVTKNENAHSVGGDIWRSAVQNYLEYATEGLGELVPTGMAAKLLGNSKVSTLFAKTFGDLGKAAGSKGYGAIKKVTDLASVQGIPSEVMEEVVNALGSTALTGSNDIDQLSDPAFYKSIALNTILLGGTFKGAQLATGGVGNRIEKNRVNKQANSSVAALEGMALNVTDESLANQIKLLSENIKAGAFQDEQGNIENGMVSQSLEEVRKAIQASNIENSDEVLGAATKAVIDGAVKSGAYDGFAAIAESEMGGQFAHKKDPSSVIIGTNREGEQFYMLDRFDSGLDKEIHIVRPVNGGETKSVTADEFVDLQVLDKKEWLDAWLRTRDALAPIQQAANNQIQAEEQQIQVQNTPITIDEALNTRTFLIGEDKVTVIDATEDGIIAVDDEGNEHVGISLEDLQRIPAEQPIEQPVLQGDQPQIQETPETQPIAQPIEQPIEAPIVEVPVEKPIPLTKDGSPDYDAMEPEMLIDELSKEFPQERVSGMMLGVIGNLQKTRESLNKKQPKGINEEVAKIKKISEIDNRIMGLRSSMEKLTPKQVAQAPKPSKELPKASVTIAEKYLAAPKVYGREKTIILANGEKLKGKYVIAEAGEFTPSHDPFSFSKTEGFPINEEGRTINDRDYEKDRDAQGLVLTHASGYDGRAINNPVIITKDGVVVSGNDRTMSGIIAAQQGTDKAYLDMLTEDADMYGVNPEDLKTFKNPRIAIELAQDIPYSTKEFAKFNDKDMKSQNRVETAVKAGKSIGEGTVRKVSSIIDGFDTLGDFYSNEGAIKELMSVLVNDGVVLPVSIAEFMDGNSLSAIGKDQVETLLTGAVLNEDSIRLLNREGLKPYRNKIVKSVVSLIENRSLGDYAVMDRVNGGIRLLDVVHNGGFKHVREYVTQPALFGSEEIEPIEAYFAHVLMGKERDFRAAIDGYNGLARLYASGQPDMFSGKVKTKDEVLNDIENDAAGDTKQLFELVRNRNNAIEAQRGNGGNADILLGENQGEPAQNVGNEGIDEGAGSGVVEQVPGSEQGGVELPKDNQPAPDEVSLFNEKLAEEEAKVDLEASDKQREAGNYQKGHIQVQGFNVSIENPKGSTRSGIDETGKKWEITMNNTYGYILGTTGKDADHIDIFLGENPQSDKIFVVDQINKDKSFDEHKVMLGFEDIESAKAAYLSNYEEGWQGLGNITGISVDGFREWADNKTRRIKPFAEYKQVQEHPEVIQEQPKAIIKEEGPVQEVAPYSSPESFNTNSFEEFSAALDMGRVQLGEFKKAYEVLKNSKEAFQLELSGKTKAELLNGMNGMGQYRYKNERKEAIVRALWDDSLMTFAFGSISYDPFGGKMENAIDKKVANTTQANIDEYVKESQRRRDEYAARVKEFKKGLTNPETLPEFKIFIDRNGLDKLSPEQKAAYDNLITDRVIDKRNEAKENKAIVGKVDLSGIEMDITETKHTKTGADLFVVKLSERVSKEDYQDLNSKAKQLGGYYSSFRGAGAVPGFQFKTKEQAQKFVDLKKENASNLDVIEEKQDNRVQNKVSKLRDNAQKIIDRVDTELSKDRLTNTAKRAGQAASIEARLGKEKQLAQTMMNIADAIEDGDVKLLDGISAKTHIELLDNAIATAKSREMQDKYPNYAEQMKHEGEPATLETIEYSKENFFPRLYAERIKDLVESSLHTSGVKQLAAKWTKKIAGIGERGYYQTTSDNEVSEIVEMIKANPLDKWRNMHIENAIADYSRLKSMGIENDSMLRAALREYVQYRGKSQAADPVKKLERALVGRKNIGIDFFPTPKETAQMMVDEAGITEGMDILEPSAGNGNIADAIKETGVRPDVIELSSALTEILEAKGYDVVANDFMDFSGKSYDRIIMNPPFQNGMDGDHVMHAYELLKPGGKIVAIVGEGTFIRSDKKASAFRAWLDSVGGTEEKLENGTFQDKTLLNTTGANARLVIIEKEENAILFRDTPYFYSPTEQALNAIKQEKATPEQWKAMLLKNGAKQAEMEWMQFDEFAEGKKSLSRADIQEWIDQNRIEIKEVQKGEYSNRNLEAVKVEPFIYNVVDTKTNKILLERVSQSNADDFIDNAHDGTDTKYSQYTTPGGENYKELLLTMPGEHAMTSAERQEMERLAMRMNNEINFPEQDLRRYNNLRSKSALYNDNKDIFKSSHFDESNILAHIRFNERTGKNGERVLFIEEIQSDWAQKGKKEGFRGSREWKVADAAYAEFIGRMEKKYGKDWWEDYSDEESIEDYTLLGERQKTEESAIPSMPFKKTDQWVNLSLRRMMTYAAENGFDAITWTTGEMQASRYDLSKQINTIYYAKNNNYGETSYDLDVFSKVGNDAELSNLTESELEKNVGKELAQKIISSENVSGKFEGLDLKIGGEGMKAFYDNIIPNAANKIGKSFGAQTGTIEIPADEVLYGENKELNQKDLSPEARKLTRKLETAMEGEGGDYSAEEYVSDMAKLGYQVKFDEFDEEIISLTKVSESEKRYIPVQSIPITDKIREQAAIGMPLFSIIGEKGANALDVADKAGARMNALSVARKMESMDKKPKEILLITGWQRGADKKWRYELPDILNEKLISKRTEGKYEAVFYAEDVYSKELLSAYPEIKDVMVKVAINPVNRNRGSYANGVDRSAEGLFDLSPEIEVRAKDIQNAKEILIHEVQHYIQDKEGFAEGGSPAAVFNSWDEGKQEEYKRLTNEYESLKDAADSYGYQTDVLMAIREVRGQLEKLNLQKQYWRLSGEVEARNASNRSKMTEAERRGSLLENTEDISRKDQIYFQKAKAAEKLLNEATDRARSLSIFGERGVEKLAKISNGATMLDNLATARLMENNNKAPLEIKQTTGWERGADAKWRFEMPDFELKMPFEDIKTTEPISIEDVISDEALFTAYPQLKDFKISFYEGNQLLNQGGSANYQAKTIRIGTLSSLAVPSTARGSAAVFANGNASLKSVLSHEVQHIIQRLEGFERGGNKTTVRDALVKNKVIQLQKNPELAELSDREKEQIAENEVSRTYDSAYDSYIRLGGEVEARNAQHRLKLSDKEKKNTLLESTEDVARKYQFIIDEAVYAESDTPSAIHAEALTLAETLNTPVRIVSDINEIPASQIRFRQAKGWFDPKTGDIIIVLPNNNSVADIQATILHEVVAHKGLRELLGSKFNSVMEDIFRAMPGYAKADFLAKYGDRVAAAEEYAANMSEKDITPSVWQKIKAIIRNAFRAIGINLRMNDGDIAFMLWRSKNKLKNNPTAIETAKDIVDSGEMKERMRSMYQMTPQSAEIARLEAIKKAAISEKNRLIKSGSDRIGLFGDTKVASNDMFGGEGFDPSVINGLIKEQEDLIKTTDAKISLLKQNEMSGLIEASGQLRFDNAVNFRDGDLFSLDTNTIKLTKGEKFIESWQDRMVSGTKLIEEIKKRGGKVGHFSNFVTEETRSSSRAKAEMDDFEDNYFKPMIDKVGEWAKKGIKRAETELYVMAKHAPERNRMIVSREARDKVLYNLDLELRKTENKRKTATDPKKIAGIDKASEVLRNEIDFINNEKNSALINMIIENGYDVVFNQGGRGVIPDNLTTLEYMMAVNAQKKIIGSLESISQSELGNNRSGMSDIDAAEIVKEFEKRVQPSEITEFWKLVNAATQFSLDKSRKYGLISDETYKATKGMYKYYVPLRSWAEKEKIDYQDIFGSNYLGHEILNTVNKQAEGRTSLADNPFGFIASMAESSVVSGNKNEVRRNAWRLIKNNGDMTDLFLIKNSWEINVADPEDAPMWEETFVPPTQEQLDLGIARPLPPNNAYKWHKTKGELEKHQVPVYVDGNRVIMEFKGTIGPRVAAAINGENVVRWAHTDGIAQFTRVMAALKTSKNPDFMLTNFLRDFYFGNMAYYVRGGNPLMLTYNLGRSWAAIHKDFTKGKEDPYLKQMYEDFKMNGGQTGYVYMLGEEKYEKKIERMVKQANEVGRISPAIAAKRTFNILNHGLDYLAHMSEDAMRFSVYLTEVERMMKESSTTAPTEAIKKQGALAAKDATTNFNRKGRYGSQTNAFYAFFNASIQGTTNYVKLAKENPARFITANLVLMGIRTAFTAWCLSLIGGDDDDEGYAALSDYIKENNFVIPAGGGKFVTIPLPHGARAFTNIGPLALEVLSGRRKAGKATDDYLRSIVSEVSPFNLVGLDKNAFIIPTNFKEGILTIMPTAVRPLAEVAANIDFMGRPIEKKNFLSTDDDKVPRFQNAYASTNKILIGVAKYLNELGGGNAERSAGMHINKSGENWTVEESKVWGAFDVSPAYTEHILESYFGGVGRFVNDLYKTAVSASKGEVPAKQNIPVFRRLYQEPYETKAWQNFYEIRKRVLNTDGSIKAAKDVGNQSEYVGLNNAYNIELAMKFDTYNKVIRNIAKNKLALPEDSPLRKQADEAIDSLVKNLDAEIKEIDKRYNRR